MKKQSGATPTAHDQAAADVNGVGIVGHTSWVAQRLAAVHQASGVCARCGGLGADTAFRSWDSSELLAGHTRCVVGLGPAATTRG